MAYCHFPSYCCWPLLPNKPFSRSQCLSFAKCFTSRILPNIFHKDVRKAMSIPAYRWENWSEERCGAKLEEELLSWLCHASPFQITQAALGSCPPAHPQDPPFSSSWSCLLSFLVPSSLPFISFHPTYETTISSAYTGTKDNLRHRTSSTNERKSRSSLICCPFFTLFHLSLWVSPLESQRFIIPSASPSK